MKKIQRHPIEGATPLTPMEMNDYHLGLGHTPLRKTPKGVKKSVQATQTDVSGVIKK